jgi:hypothetical protein
MDQPEITQQEVDMVHFGQVTASIQVLRTSQVAGQTRPPSRDDDRRSKAPTPTVSGSIVLLFPPAGSIAPELTHRAAEYELNDARLDARGG